MKNELSLDDFISELEFGTVFIFSDEKEYYLDRFIIKEPEKDAAIFDTYRVKQGTYQDEVFCRVNDLADFDFCFFPYQGNRLKFFSWSEHFKPVYLCNEGNRDLEIDTPFGIFLLPSKERCLCVRENRAYQIDEPLVPAIDKHNVNDVYLEDGKKVGYGVPNNDPVVIDIKKK